MLRADFLPRIRNLEDGEWMNPTETVRAAVCAYAVGVGKPEETIDQGHSPDVEKAGGTPEFRDFVSSSQTTA